MLSLNPSPKSSLAGLEPIDIAFLTRSQGVSQKVPKIFILIKTEEYSPYIQIAQKMYKHIMIFFYGLLWLYGCFSQLQLMTSVTSFLRWSESAMFSSQSPLANFLSSCLKFLVLGSHGSFQVKCLPYYYKRYSNFPLFDSGPFDLLTEAEKYKLNLLTALISFSRFV